MPDAHTYLEFRHNLTVANSNENFANFAGKCVAKQLLSDIFRRHSTAERQSELNAIQNLVGSKNFRTTDDPAKSLAAGTIHKDVCWAYYYYLHRMAPQTLGLADVDRAVLGSSRTYPEVFGQYVDGLRFEGAIHELPTPHRANPSNWLSLAAAVVAATLLIGWFALNLTAAEDDIGQMSAASGVNEYRAAMNALRIDDQTEFSRQMHLASDQGNVTAKAGLALLHYSTRSEPYDRELATEYATTALNEGIQELAESGNADALYWLANLNAVGLGMPEDDSSALTLFRQAKVRGVDRASFQLAIIAFYSMSTEDDCTGFDEGQRAAEAGHVAAISLVGKYYRYGICVDQNYEEAIVFFQRASLAGYPDGHKNLGEMYRDGLGIEPSASQAVQLFQRAADGHFVDAMVDLGRMYEKGLGVEQSHAVAYAWYRKAADLDLATGQHNVGVMFANGWGVEQSDNQAFEWYEKAAAQGNVFGHTSLGSMYANGRGVRQSYELAAASYRKAADQQHAPAQTKLGEMYEEGRGVEQSDETAFDWFQRAAEQGDARGQANLAWMYEHGLGGTQSDEQAAIWYRKAAEQGNSEGENSLGLFYEEGRGVSQDWEQAVLWYRRAADQGSAFGQTSLGKMYEDGRGVEQSFELAVKWYQNASAQGYARGQTSLGWMYWYGHSVEQDGHSAFNLFARGAAQDDEWSVISLGISYLLGVGTEVSLDRSMQYCGLAPTSKAGGYCIGLIYYLQNQEKPLVSAEEAEDALFQSAEQGNVHSAILLGMSYVEQTFESDKPVDDAEKWFRRAASSGDAYAKYNLGVFLITHRGVTLAEGSEPLQLFKDGANAGHFSSTSALISYHMTDGDAPRTYAASKFVDTLVELGKLSASDADNLLYQYDENAEQLLGSVQNSFDHPDLNRIRIYEDDARSVTYGSEVQIE